LNGDMNAALLGAGRDVGGAMPMDGGMPGQPPEQGGGTGSPVFQMGTQMLDALEQDPSPDNQAAFVAIMTKGSQLIQGMQQPQGQPAPQGMPPEGGLPMQPGPAMGG